MDDPSYTPFGYDPNRLPGCPAGRDDLPGESGWTCTDHFDWYGQTLHVAASSAVLCAVALDPDLVWTVPPAERKRLAQWPALREALLNDVRFAPPVTDEEVQAAAAATRQLVEEMESWT